ncbi:MAG: hypothetical protein JRC86_03965 [Deltaproteobacteria bacterium]|nr:hypothetical protein [Deltaproteobacteria bacterium]
MVVIGLGSLLSGTLAVAGVSVSFGVAQTTGPWSGVFSALVVIVAVVGSGLALKKISSSEKTVTERFTAADERTQIGEFDISPETLEFELRALIGELTQSKWPCVFVIDELDKLETVGQGGESASKLESHVIFDIVSVLKNFFTLGAGIYVFIAGEDFYSQLNESISGGDYSLAHTLFTDRLFIHILHYHAIEQLIDTMVEEEPSDNIIYKKFKNYLCWESRNHIFDLLSLIDEFVLYQHDHPVLLAREEGEEDGRWQAGNLPQDWQNAAGLQKYAGAAYDESCRSSAREERYNQALWLRVIYTLKKLQNGQVIEVVDGEYTVPAMAWTKGLNDKDMDDLAGAVERLFAKLERYGTVAVEETIKTETFNDITKKKEIIQYELHPGALYPPSTVGTESILIPIEKSFVELSKKVQDLSENIQSSGVNVDSFSEELEKVTKMADLVQKTTFRLTVPRSQTREGIKQADLLAKRLIDAGINGSIHKWAEASGAEISKNIDEIEPRTNQPWKASLGQFSELADVLASYNINYYILGVQSLENQLLVINNSEGEDLSIVSDAYSQALQGEKGREIRKQRLPILIIDHQETVGESNIPQEVVDEIENEYEGMFFLASWLLPPKRRKKKEKLSGWNIISLSSDLSNLSELSKQMTTISFMTSNP